MFCVSERKRREQTDRITLSKEIAKVSQFIHHSSSYLFENNFLQNYIKSGLLMVVIVSASFDYRQSFFKYQTNACCLDSGYRYRTVYSSESHFTYPGIPIE
jgi:hypothetical protein